MAYLTRRQYAQLYGPTTGDRIRLADTDLLVEITEDRSGGPGAAGEEAVFGGGKVLRVKGQGPGGSDLHLKIRIDVPSYFRREGNDVFVEVPLTIAEAVLGSKVDVPTLDGSAELTLPPNVNTSKALRLKGKGLHANGDLYATIKIVLPDNGDPDLESLMRFWRDQKPYKVRD